MGHIYTTKDGKKHTIIDYDDIDKVIEEYLGSEFTQNVSDTINNLQDELSEVKTELEFAYEEENRVYTEIRDMLDEVLELFKKDKVKKLVVQDKLKQILYYVYQQI